MKRHLRLIFGSGPGRARLSILGAAMLLLKAKSMSKLILSSFLICFAGIVTPAMAQNYDFKPSPHISLNRIYRVDRLTGEMGACQYGLVDNSVGASLCYPAGEGATAQNPGEYELIASSHQQESGIFRVNRRTGDMSICYVLNDEKVVCTPQAREAANYTASVPVKPADAVVARPGK